MMEKKPAKNSKFYIPVKKGKTAAAVKKTVAKKSAAPKKK